MDTEKRRTEQSENIRGDIQYLARLLTAVEGQQRVIDKTTSKTFSIQLCNLLVYKDFCDNIVSDYFPEIANEAKRLARKK